MLSNEDTARAMRANGAQRVIGAPAQATAACRSWMEAVPFNHLPVRCKRRECKSAAQTNRSGKTEAINRETIANAPKTSLIRRRMIAAISAEPAAANRNSTQRRLSLSRRARKRAREEITGASYRNAGVCRGSGVDPVSSIASAGLATASRDLSASGKRIVQAALPQPASVPVQSPPKNDAGVESRIDGAIAGLGAGIDLIRETINQSAAAVAYRANLATLNTADETQRSLLEVVS
jgi:hypothetical protein